MSSKQEILEKLGREIKRLYMEDKDREHKLNGDRIKELFEKIKKIKEQ